MKTNWTVTATDSLGYTLVCDEFETLVEARTQYNLLATDKAKQGFAKVRIENEDGTISQEQ